MKSKLLNLRKKLKLLAILCLGSTVLLQAQEQFGIKDEDNKIWLTDLENASDKSAKILMIKNKIELDSQYVLDQAEKTNFWKEQVINDTLTTSQANLDKYQLAGDDCNCKMKFMLVVKDDQFNLDATKYNFVKPVLNEVQPNTIDTILIKNNFKTNDIYENKECGIIYLYTNSIQLKQEIKDRL